MTNKVDEGGFREEPIQKMMQEQKKIENFDNKNNSQTKLYNILGTVITGLVVPYLITITEPKIILKNDQLKVTANSSSNVYGHFLNSKKDFKSLEIYSKNQNIVIGTWDSKSGAQHPGINYVEPTTYTSDTTICPGSNLLEGILFNCLADIRNQALKTESAKQFYQSLENK